MGGGFEEGVVLVGGVGPGEGLALGDDRSGGEGIAEERAEGGGDGGEAWFDEAAAGVTGVDFFDAADATGDYGEAAGEGFEDDIGDAFVDAGEAEDIGGLHIEGDFGGGFAAGEHDIGTEVELVAEGAGVIDERAIADHDEFGMGEGIIVADLGMGFDEEEGIFDGVKVPDEENDLFICLEIKGLPGDGAIFGLEALAIDAIVDGVEIFFGEASGGEEAG